VLRELRRDLDARYKDRMLLAEANGWPGDVRSYFGEGDECHMAFNFPLMPRICLGMLRRTHTRIAEIIRQTPDLPATCQWAIFLLSTTTS
jgi:maltose alpha-D-glucosyltransferase/alpha-amylase